MLHYTTALGRMVPARELQTLLEDSVLKLLFDYRLSPQNPDNVPMKLSTIVHAVSNNQALVVAALDALKEQHPPLVEEISAVGERSFRLTGSGVRFVRNCPQGLESIS